MTITVSLNDLWNNYPSVDDYSANELYEELGWPDLVNKPGYENTCAVRMSLCLIKSGINVEGRFEIKKGKYKGKKVEPGQLKLSQFLADKKIFGKPQVFKIAQLENVLLGKQGVVSFMRIPGYIVAGGLGGHIDLVKHGKFLFFWDKLVCQSGCHWDAEEFWFWPMS